MRKAPLVLAAAAVLGLTAVAAPSPAEARYWRGGGFFPAVAGGLIAGAVIGGLASNAYAYGPGYGYYGGYGPGITAADTPPPITAVTMVVVTRRLTMAADITALPWFAIVA